MDPITMGMLGAAGVSLVGSIAGNAFSANNAKKDREFNQKIARQNLAFQQQNLDYQKALQQQIFQREDTAVQRRKSDLLAAGMNPYLSATQPGAGAGSVVSTSAPQNNFQSTLARDMSGISKNIAETPGQILDVFSTIQKIKQESLYTKYMEIQNKMANLGYSDARNNFMLDWSYSPDGSKYYPFVDGITKGSASYNWFKQTNAYKSYMNRFNQINLGNQLMEKDIDFYIADKIEGYLLNSLNGFGKYSFMKNYKRR